MGPHHVLNYLARYTHRVAISNHRLVAFENQRVSFRWKDYAHGSKNKIMTVPADEFLRRYLLHVLPKGLVRIRHFGLFANRCRAASLQRCRSLLGSEPRLDPSLTAASQPPCPVCSGPMMMVQRITPQDLRYALIPSGNRRVRSTAPEPAPRTDCPMTRSNSGPIVPLIRVPARHASARLLYQLRPPATALRATPTLRSQSQPHRSVAAPALRRPRLDGTSDPA